MSRRQATGRDGDPSDNGSQWPPTSRKNTGVAATVTPDHGGRWSLGDRPIWKRRARAVWLPIIVFPPLTLRVLSAVMSSGDGKIWG